MPFQHYYKFFKIFTRLVIILGLFNIFNILNQSNSYYFGLKSADNTPENIETIEGKMNVKLPIISFIFDPREENDVLNSIDRIVDILGTDRIYHFTISPNSYSAKEITLGSFDEHYIEFFQKVKEKNLHVIFRTMHEMNGGWYPRSSNPDDFKEARTHVRNLSRIIGLNEENIAFDFSVNHRDMPTEGTPSQSASLIQCNQRKKDCYHFEDYYPGDEFVDIVGFTFYNRGKAIGNRQRLSPTEILYDKNWNTYERLKNFNKPIIIDEVATTSVRYEGNYDYDKSRNEYLNHDERKDYWIYQLWEFLINHQEIISAIYFNTDYTHGLNLQITGEADRAIINIDDNKVYGGFQELEMFGEKDLNNILNKIFHLEKISVDGDDAFIPKNCSKQINIIISIINKKTESAQEKENLIKKLGKIDFKSECITKSLQNLEILYAKKILQSSID